jgi:hypothetical protein
MKCSRRIRVLGWAGLAVAVATQSALAQANAAANAAEEIGVPKLVPPYSELPPTFWERNGVTVVIYSIAGLLIVSVLVWLLRRSKPAVVLPPEVRARRALESLRPKAEDGAVLSQVSRILRDYFRATFELPPDELTTTEFCGVVSKDDKIGAELAAKVSDFLRLCDVRKFSAHSAVGVQASACSGAQSGSPDTLKRELQPTAVAAALELIALSEARRAQVQPTVTPAQS